MSRHSAAAHARHLLGRDATDPLTRNLAASYIALAAELQTLRARERARKARQPDVVAARKAERERLAVEHLGVPLGDRLRARGIARAVADVRAGNRKRRAA